MDEMKKGRKTEEISEEQLEQVVAGSGASEQRIVRIVMMEDCIDAVVMPLIEDRTQG